MGITRPEDISPVHEPDPQETEILIKELASLPPLPRQSQILLAELSDPELDIPRLVELLLLAPALTARLLGIARSAFFAGPIPARDLHDAIVRVLGLNLVRDMGICFLLSSQLQVNRCPPYEPARYWKRALMTATLAQNLALATSAAGPGEFANAYLAGLLHNLGLPALVHVAPGPMIQALTQAEHDADLPLAQIEHRRLGVDHYSAGMCLATAWRLPPELAAVMAHHPETDYRGEHRWLVALIGLAERYCAHLEQPHRPKPGHAHLGIAQEDWKRITGAWLSRRNEIADLARAFA